MAKVSLRIYNRDIESLIDQNRLDEAIAHCRHILQTFSKHLDTYRLLGKAYLEAKRYDEAVDIFSRVLMAVPDDFVAHVGMSIIRDDQAKLDEAIWHMERAFESQPSNAAIQGELQRLFGRRDGVEPPKIRMTRGALAHMYVQGELYPQAISEIKAVLGQDPQRDDMKTLLARAYFHAGQKADASDVCSQLLKRYPYSFDANRIMVELLQTSESVETTQVYRHRVNELDPYSTFAQGSVFRSADVSDAAVNLERLEYKGQDVQLSPDWSASSISLGTQATSQEPDWLKSDLFASPQEEKPAPVSKGDADIPDFLRQAGWTESSGAAEQPPSVAAGPDAEPPLAEGEMPDWLKAMAPAEPSESAAPVPAEPASKSTSADIPDWLRSLDDSQSVQQPAGSSDVPDWLGGLSKITTAGAAGAASNDIPDWLRGSDDTGVAAPAVSPQDASLPDWIKSTPEAAPAEPAPVSTPASVDKLGTTAKEQEDAVAWLESLAAKHGAKSEELVTDPNARSEKPPEWVKQASELGATSQPAVPAESKPVEPVAQKPEPPAPPVSAPSPSVETLGTTTKEQDDAVAWLESLAAKHGAKAEELVTDPNARSEQPPEWVRQASELGVSEPTAPAEPKPVEPVPQTLEPSAPSMDETGMWLRDLAGKETSFQEETFQAEQAPASTDELANWLSSLDEAEKTSKPVEEEPVSPMQAEAPAEATDLPSWLKGLEKEAPPAQASTSEELPDWLKVEAEAPAQPEPTAPTDWHPVESQPEPELKFEPEPEPQPQFKFEPEPPEPEMKPVPEPELEPESPARYVAPPRPAPAAKKALVREARPAPAKPITRPRQTGMLTPVVDPALAAAQTEMSRGDIPAALEHFDRLIKKGRWLEEIIQNLRDALYRYPVEVSIWQALGDAYMRTNRLQEALDAYTKAEELLR